MVAPAAELTEPSRQGSVMMREGSFLERDGLPSWGWFCQQFSGWKWLQSALCKLSLAFLLACSCCSPSSLGYIHTPWLDDTAARDARLTQSQYLWSSNSVINLLVAMLYSAAFNANILLVFSLSPSAQGAWGAISAWLIEDSTEARGPTLSLWSSLGIFLMACAHVEQCI